MAQILTIGEQLESASPANSSRRLPAGAARNAVDCALWDLAVRRVWKTIPQLLNTGLPNRVVTAQTVAIGTLEQRWRAAPPRCGRKGPATEGETG